MKAFELTSCPFGKEITLHFVCTLPYHKQYNSRNSPWGLPVLQSIEQALLLPVLSHLRIN